ncbi:putative outer membrane starch-binding protein [Sphingobacterium allocomposti]|uniref:Putative outer membrane starch-binding protein n=1 Tax=Sphingobacterium allocomposti TaxID=415956 RepID=A0A5S5DQW3_9SPHI|nr:RagB/SusD family nutrient uptake outer membrane protein [Sphingobacterium composti Yoo et al. 2007 non Ten et al. 2007]TYP97242.1 putative outer membrane starch-binding protein [Sphingobacterium composti Yoo et al. 2007 non Ten et al. 2007]HLS95064.1 RagB/SusD family nutrient uptake outer membrane protein [Sphingobacterium sp.]
MKNIHIKVSIGIACTALLFGSCNQILEEEPRNIFTPDYFKTEKGVMGGVTALYGHLRWIYGNGYYLNACLTGTDEYTYAQAADANFRDLDLSGVGIVTPEGSRADVLWNAAFPAINTASGIIENAEEVGTISDALIAEARFFRAFDYFLLVQTFGGVPLDLGAGELKFNTSTFRGSVRNTVPEVYTKAVFPDLKQAIEDLPEIGRVTGGVTKTLARLYLAKAYLTYAWWLENPNNIPTYPETARTDPDGHNAGYYFQQAYNIAVDGIENPGNFGLETTYYDVNYAPNDRNKEILLYADHTEESEYFNGGSHSWGNGGSPDNFAVWMVTWDYTFLESATTADWASVVRSVQRQAAQAYGRPWTRMAPTQNAIINTFADKTNDSRYDGTFVTTWRGNWDKAGLPNAVLYNANGMPVRPGDAILTILNEEPAQPIDYSNTTYKSNVGAGVLPGRADFVMGPTAISRRKYPNLWKLGMYRTNDGGGLGQPNGGSTRPFNIAKFSELYFVAAEAAVKGASVQAGKSARDLINVIRARAGVWRWDNNGNVEKNQDQSAQMIAATPLTITVDYILDERSREYFGEGYRWFDLVRTQKWQERARTYQIAGPNIQDHTPVTFNRTIEPYHYLRPIPQGQMDAMELEPAAKTAYQNPGYN